MPILLQAGGLRRTVDARVLFDDLDLELRDGQAVFITGPSGCGKSSLLRLLAGLDPLDVGQLSLQGRSFLDWGATRWRAAVCLVAQQPPDRVQTPQQTLDEIQRFAVHRGTRFDDPRMIAEPWGLTAARFDVPWADLSGGERQRAALALALARRPTVLLLDEPTAALDTPATLAVEQTLRGQSCIWVTHDADQVDRLADRTVAL